MRPLYLQAPALFAPGLDSWENALPVLRGETRYHYAPLPKPNLESLPPQERRRSSATTRLALQVAQASLAAHTPGDDFAAIFTSANGDTEILHHICAALAEPQPLVSPMRFHNSVHNAPAGYWGIANRNRCPTSSLAAHDGSFTAGLVAAAAQLLSEQRPLLLVGYDLPFPAPLDAQRPIVEPFALALQLTPEATDASLARCTLALVPDEGAGSPLADAGLERLRQGNPTARALPLLRHLATAEGGDLTLDYQEGLSLRAVLEPC